jgi:hypothetical protein
LKITKFNKKHIPNLEAIWDGSKSPFPDLTSPLFIIRSTVIDKEGKVIGGGFVKIVAEAVIFVEPSLSLYNKASMVCMLFEKGKLAMLKKGFDEFYAFVRDTPSFVTFLMKKLDFERLDVATLFKRLI